MSEVAQQTYSEPLVGQVGRLDWHGSFGFVIVQSGRYHVESSAFARHDRRALQAKGCGEYIVKVWAWRQKLRPATCPGIHSAELIWD